MRCLVALLLPTLLLGPLIALLPTAADAATVRLDGVTVRLRPGTSQVVTANRSHGHAARVRLWSLQDGRWRVVASTGDGRIGYGGLSRPAQRHQGDGTTPTGTFDLTFAFGTLPRQAGWRMPYHRIRKGDYWVGDNSSASFDRAR